MMLLLHLSMMKIYLKILIMKIYLIFKNVLLKSKIINLHQKHYRVIHY